VNVLTDLQLGWIVGLIEGEGCIQLRKPARPNVTVASTDADVIEKLLILTGIGTTRTAKRKTKRNKQVYVWNVTKRDDAGRLLELILPHLCKRRNAKASKTISAWKSLLTRGTELTCKRGHPFSGRNLKIERNTDGSFRKRHCRECHNLRRRRVYRSCEYGQNIHT